MRKNVFATATTILSLLVIPTGSYAAAPTPVLCYSDEITLFSCSTAHKNQMKTVSVCANRYQANVSYRFGNPEKTELSISLFDTTRGVESQAAKRESYSNGEQLSIEFANREYTYAVWSTDRDEHGVSITRNGSIVGNLSCVTVNKGLDLIQLQNQFPMSDNL